EGAGYLPRTWAKLEIDRLLAEDGAKHKDRIVELSKAMYVMSPFTSLLVLETEADYARFKVDRGRKDHWAMYAAPAEIPGVYEPLQSVSQPVTVSPAEGGKRPTAEAVLQSVLLRTAPQYVQGKSRAPVTALTGLDLYRGAYAVAGYPANVDLTNAGQVNPDALIDPPEIKELLATGKPHLGAAGE